MEIGFLVVPQRKLSSAVGLIDNLLPEISPDYIWVCDRLLSNFTNLFTSSSDDQTGAPAEFLDPFLTISAVARSCGKLPEFGIAVTDFIRRAPPDLARACNTIGQIIGRPLNIGFGSGEAINLKPLGYGLQAKPVSFLENELQRFAQINGSGICRSDKYEVELGYNDRPSKIWIGGQRERMLELTARYADGWLPAWKMSPDEYRHKKVMLARLAADCGRPCPKSGLLAGLMMGESRQAVLSEIDRSPLLKLLALELPAELWSRWGISHPGGERVKGTPDLVVHDLPTKTLRDIATSIPIGLLAEKNFYGNATEILEELGLQESGNGAYLAYGFY